jgi:hypothetical protein
MSKKGLEAVVLIATDCLPTSPEGDTLEAINHAFIHALQHLQSLGPGSGVATGST